jgi:hypothetical protein
LRSRPVCGVYRFRPSRLDTGRHGPHWVELCMDEVYVRDGVGLEKVIGMAVHPADADSIIREFHADFRRLEIPLYDYGGKVLWPTSEKPAKAKKSRAEKKTQLINFFAPDFFASAGNIPTKRPIIFPKGVSSHDDTGFNTSQRATFHQG